jgi:hypothetical protein
MSLKWKKWRDNLGMLNSRGKKYRLDWNIVKHNGKLKYKCLLKIMKKDKNLLMNNSKKLSNYCKICIINP